MMRIFITCLVFTFAASGDLPREVWRHEALSNLYAPPLVADVASSPGQEIIISDSEAGMVRCIDAQGNAVWSHAGGWAKRLISPAALSDRDADGVRHLAVGNGDGSLSCLDAASGTLLWRRETPPVEWGGALWTKHDSTGNSSVVLGTEHGGVIAFSATGDERWHFKAEAVTPPLHIRGPLTACDITGDGRDELFGLSRFGPFALDADGGLLWTQFTGDDFPGGPVVVDTNHDGRPELYAASYDDQYLWRFDASTGTPVWKSPLYGRVDTYSASSIAVGDIVGDGVAEIVLGDGTGTVYAFHHGGSLLWTFSIAKPTHSAISLGDVNGDGFVEVLVASGDQHLYCLTGQGRLQWRYKTDLRLIYPATLTDLDYNGMTDILLCGSDRHLRRLTLDGRYSAQRMPWPSRRHDAAQRGGSFDSGGSRPRRVRHTEALALHGDFEQGKVRDGLEQFDPESPFYEQITSRPRGWQAASLDDNNWGLSKTRVFQGEQALELAAPMTVVSEPMTCLPSWRLVSASVYVSGSSDDARATLRWVGDYGLIREDMLQSADQEQGWRRLAVSDSVPPNGARRLIIALHGPTAPTYWDAAAATVVHEEAAAFDIVVNQAGYDLAAPKRFVVQANFKADEAQFMVVDDEDHAVHANPLVYEGRIKGHYGNDWGYEYYSGDFSDFDKPGRYRICAVLDDITEYSFPLVIDNNHLWHAAALPAWRFFFYQRCGMAIPGFYDACHLDDAASPDGNTHYDLWGGWHDAGDYNKYHNAPYVYRLAVAYAQQREAFDALGMAHTGFSTVFDEILWGGDHVRRMVMEDGSAFGHITSGYGYWGPPELETDNIPGTGDERRGTREGGDVPDAHHAALARIAVLLGDKAAVDIPAETWAATAARSLAYALEENRRSLWQLSTAVDLYVATGKEQYAQQAKTLREELFATRPTASLSAMHIETLRRYDAAFDTGYAHDLRDQVLAKAKTMLANADNPFGVYTFGPPERPNFFNTPADQGGWHVGTSSHLLEAAAFMALAFQYEPDPRFLNFVYDQFNWTLGMNPYNISLMEGVGNAFAPSYHHRYTFAGVPRGAVPGGVVNGITWRSVGDDRPSFDMSGVDIPAYESNEVWLPHNTAFINALTQLKQAQE